MNVDPVKYQTTKHLIKLKHDNTTGFSEKYIY